MNIDARENQPKSVLDRINEIRHETKIGTFDFEYLHDPRYLNANPQLRAALDQLHLPDITITEAEKVVKELRIQKKFRIATVIPDGTEMRQIIPSLGIGGRAVSSDEVRLYHDLNNPNVIESLTTWRKRGIAHELNHIARMQAGKIGSSLLDAFISEGLATFTEEHWGNTFQQTPWGHVLDDNELTKEWTLAQAELYSNKYNHREWFFDREGKHPLHTGYSLGTAIVEKLISQQPRIPMWQLVRMPSARILKMSDFIYKIGSKFL
jgi:hypothetical protein